MIKLYTSFLITLPLVFFGFYYSYKDTYRYNDLRELYKALNIFKNEINFSYLTLSNSFLSISKKINNPISAIFKTLSENIESNNNDNFDEIFEKSINIHMKTTFLNKRDVNEFLSLSKTINYLDNNAIISSINIFLIYLENELQSLEEIKNKNKKIYQSLTILSSILIVILLL